MVTWVKKYFFHLIEMSYICRDPDLFVTVFTIPSTGPHIVDAQYMLVVPLSHGEGQAFQKGLHMKCSFRKLSET